MKFTGRPGMAISVKGAASTANVASRLSVRDRSANCVTAGAASAPIRRARESAAKNSAPMRPSMAVGAVRWIVVPAVIRRMLPGRPISAAAAIAIEMFGALKSAKNAAAVANWVRASRSRTIRQVAAYVLRAAPIR